MTKSKTKATSRLRAPKTAKLKTSRKTSTENSPVQSKQARIVEMLNAPGGTTIAAIVTTTGWQQHSVRGFLAGVVRKKLGLNLVSEHSAKGRIYRVKDGKSSLVAGVRAKQAA